MSKLKKLAKKAGGAAKVAINPVMAGTTALTGLSMKDQLAIGASVGGTMSAVKGMQGVKAAETGGQYVDTGLGSGYTMPIGRQGNKGAGLGLMNWAPSVVGLAGDIYSARTMAKGQEAANEASLASAREQMQFQERMSSTAHQREVEDLKAAGLNPVLSSNSGASSPVGESVTFENQAPNYRGTISSAFEARKTAADVNESVSRAMVNKAQLYVMASQQEQNQASADNLREEKAVNKVNAKLGDIRARQLEVATKWLEDHKGTLTIDKYLEYAKDLIHSAAEAVNTAFEIKSGGKNVRY